LIWRRPGNLVDDFVRLIKRPAIAFGSTMPILFSGFGLAGLLGTSVASGMIKRSLLWTLGGASIIMASCARNVFRNNYPRTAYGNHGVFNATEPNESG
jgi:hypothetical protein